MRDYMASNYQLMNDFVNDLFSNESGAFEFIDADVVKDEKGYTIELDIPGVQKESLNITYEKEYLTVSAQRKLEEDKNKKYLCKERSTSFKRTFLIRGIDEDGITAKYVDGVLTVYLPLKEKVDGVKKVVIE